MCSQNDDPTTYDRPHCGQRIHIQGEDRACGQTVGITSWNDYTGQPHHACPRHVGGMKRRWPESVVPEVEGHGKLGLSTPWARGLFGPNDLIAVANEIPEGWTLGVSVSAHRSWVILWLIDPSGTERARWPNHPLRDAIGGATKLARLAQTMAAEGPEPVVVGEGSSWSAA